MRLARRGLIGLTLAVSSIAGVVAPGTASATTVAEKRALLHRELGSYSVFVDMYRRRAVAPYRSFDWRTDFCSWSPDRPLGVDFSMPCRRHDFNYRNFKATRIFTSANRSKIDLVFYVDLRNVCARAAWYKRPTCYAVATTFYRVVRLFGG